MNSYTIRPFAPTAGNSDVKDLLNRYSTTADYDSEVMPAEVTETKPGITGVYVDIHNELTNLVNQFKDNMIFSDEFKTKINALISRIPAEDAEAHRAVVTSSTMDAYMHAIANPIPRKMTARRLIRAANVPDPLSANDLLKLTPTDVLVDKLKTSGSTFSQLMGGILEGIRDLNALSTTPYAAVKKSKTVDDFKLEPFIIFMIQVYEEINAAYYPPDDATVDQILYCDEAYGAIRKAYNYMASVANGVDRTIPSLEEIAGNTRHKLFNPFSTMAGVFLCRLPTNHIDRPVDTHGMRSMLHDSKLTVSLAKKLTRAAVYAFLNIDPAAPPF